MVTSSDEEDDMGLLNRLIASKPRCAVCRRSDVPLAESAHLTLYCDRCSGRLRGVLGSFLDQSPEVEIAR